MAKRATAIALLLLVAVAAVGPIRSYDFFWHLATGRWIVEHRALPVDDPFTLASARTPWINGEWLYEVVFFAANSLAGLAGICWLNALFIAVIFTAGFWFAIRDHDIGFAVSLAAVAFAGASDRLGVRPSTAAAFLVMLAIALLGSRMGIARLTILYALLTVAWINVHPSALLAPLIAAATMTVSLRRWIVAAASGAALLINPYGWRAIAAPVQLTSLIREGEFVNAEWLPSTPDLFPLLYATMAAVILVFLFSNQKRSSAWRLLVFAGLAVLAVRHVRNQGLYFAAMPLLLAPTRRPPRNVTLALAACALIPIGWAFRRADHGTGVDDKRFPVRAVALLKASNLSGNIYNVDQFGGYLEWVFYRQRRVLTDGRNELFRDFISEDARARRDSRAWHELLRKYRIDLAVDEYQTEKTELVDMATGEHRFLPASLVRYRRRDWALIAFDDAAMVFARRAAYPAETIDRMEYRYLVPDDPFIGYADESIRSAARTEIARARKELGNLNVVKELERGAGD